MRWIPHRKESFCLILQQFRRCADHQSFVPLVHNTPTIIKIASNICILQGSLGNRLAWREIFPILCPCARVCTIALNTHMCWRTEPEALEPWNVHSEYATSCVSEDLSPKKWSAVVIFHQCHSQGSLQSWRFTSITAYVSHEYPHRLVGINIRLVFTTEMKNDEIPKYSVAKGKRQIKAYLQTTHWRRPPARKQLSASGWRLRWVQETPTVTGLDIKYHTMHKCLGRLCGNGHNLGPVRVARPAAQWQSDTVKHRVLGYSSVHNCSDKSCGAWFFFVVFSVFLLICLYYLAECKDNREKNRVSGVWASFAAGTIHPLRTESGCHGNSLPTLLSVGAEMVMFSNTEPEESPHASLPSSHPPPPALPVSLPIKTLCLHRVSTKSKIIKWQAKFQLDEDH